MWQFWAVFGLDVTCGLVLNGGFLGFGESGVMVWVSGGGLVGLESWVGMWFLVTDCEQRGCLHLLHIMSLLWLQVSACEQRGCLHTRTICAAAGDADPVP